MKRLQDEAKKLSIDLSDDMIEKFHIYKETLLEYNAVMNLTAITDEYEIIIKHFLDSLTLMNTDKLTDGAKIIDIGAGAGFPSLPNAIANPKCDFTMLDSLGKRVNFLNEVTRRMNIENATAIHMRAEDGGRDKNLRENFDIATARAVADLSVLAEYALPFVKIGGYFLAMKGTAPNEETENAKKAVSLLGGKIERIMDIKIEPLNLNHTIVIVKKIAHTKSIYPRKAGTPSKEPLK